MAIVQADRQNLRVFIDGMQILGLFRAAIARTNCFSADTFALTFVMGIEPLHDIKFWSAVSSAFVEVFITDRYRSDNLSLISGHVDNIVVNPVENVVAVEGRDLSSLMIDSYRQQDFVNQTASEIVSTIALQHGLAPAVISTAGSVGRYYDDGYTKLSLGQFSRLRSDWDLVVQLARQTGFDTFVEGRSLVFRPTDIALNTVLPLSVKDVQRIRIEKSLNIKASTATKVRSWDSQYMKAYESSATDKSNSDASSGLPFLFTGTNYTPEQVDIMAGRYLSEVNRLGTILHLDMPWDGTVAPRTVILLDGTNSLFDGRYRVDSIERHYSTMSGSTQALRGTLIW